MPRALRRMLVAATLLVGAGPVAGLVTPAAPASAAAGVSLTRLAGTDRYGTAALVAEAAAPGGAGTVVVASGASFPDALTGAYLAGLQPGGAPVLLVPPRGPLPSAVTGALQHLGAHRVILVGGTAAVGGDVAGALAGLTVAGQRVTVARVSGATRYDTMAAVDAPPSGGEPAIGTVGGHPTAILATGSSFADAVAAAPLAWARHLPLVLTDGRAASLPAPARSVLASDRIGHVIVVGGPAAVSPAQVQQLRAMGITVDGTATTGSDRSQTAVELAGLETSAFGFSASRFDLVRGDQFPDALAAGALGGADQAPTLVTAGPGDPGAVKAFLVARAGGGLTGQAVGGPQALTPSLLQSLVAAGSVPAPADPPPADPYPAGAAGYDVSWPQCGGALPPRGAVDVVGVDHGRPLTTNPCLAAEASWAGPGASAYVTLASPPASWSAGSACATGDARCRSYNYGRAAATAGLNAAAAAGLDAPVWWAAVVSAESWSGDPVANADVVQGALDTLDAGGRTAGVYSTSAQWSALLGSWTTTAPSWVPADPSDPAGSCGAAGFAAGGVWLVQAAGGTWDQDGACPLPPGPLPAPPAPPPSPAPAPPAGPSSPYPAAATGYDISWPQCPSSFPTVGAVAVIGANDGHPFSVNPCLSPEAAWAGTGLSVYLNLSSPAGASQAMTGPAGPCASSDLSCQSYNFGANSVTYSLQSLGAAGVTPRFFWLDVETGNTWSSSTADNAEVVKGALAALSGAGKGAGIYSTTYQWGRIAGSYVPTVPEWVPSGMASASAAASLCGGTYFTSGPTWLVQYGAGNYDGDVAC